MEGGGGVGVGEGGGGGGVRGEEVVKKEEVEGSRLITQPNLARFIV